MEFLFLLNTVIPTLPAPYDVVLSDDDDSVLSFLDWYSHNEGGFNVVILILLLAALAVRPFIKRHLSTPHIPIAFAPCDYGPESFKSGYYTRSLSNSNGGSRSHQRGKSIGSRGNHYYHNEPR